MNSLGSAVSACQSEMWASQAMSVSVFAPPWSSRPPFMRCLYFQWAATPNSARWCISCVRIWISTGRPLGPITVV